MSVGYILQQVGKKRGLDPAIASQRETLVRILNEAADALYTQSDLPNSLWEMVFKVNGNQTITLPSYVGQMRAIREFFTQIPWHLNNIRPRYNQVTWPDMWRNWRIIGNIALQATVRNTSKGVLSVHAVETPPIEVTINGSTEFASAVTETVVMDQIEKNTENNYTDYHTIRKNRFSSYDVTLKDVDGMVMSAIPNNELEADYLVVDVSLFPFLNADVSSQCHYLEVLYKKALPWLSDDGQSFPARGYDDIIVDKCLQIFAEEEKKVDIAALYDTKVTRALGRKLIDINKATEDMVSFVYDGHDQMLARLSAKRRRYWGYPGGYYGGVGY
jgi:hypothetical protein